jgi:hypothetical protein
MRPLEIMMYESLVILAIFDFEPKSAQKRLLIQKSATNSHLYSEKIEFQV